MSNLFFYEYLVLAENHEIESKPHEIVVSGLVGATDNSPASASRLTSVIRGSVIDQGYSESEVNESRLLNIKRV